MVEYYNRTTQSLISSRPSWTDRELAIFSHLANKISDIDAIRNNLTFRYSTKEIISTDLSGSRVLKGIERIEGLIELFNSGPLLLSSRFFNGVIFIHTVHVRNIRSATRLGSYLKCNRSYLSNPNNQIMVRASVSYRQRTRKVPIAHEEKFMVDPSTLKLYRVAQKRIRLTGIVEPLAAYITGMWLKDLT